jgi:hypothetical protein
MRHHHNKDNLPANKEGRHHFKKKTYQSFGAYRPLTPDSNFHLSSAVAEITLDMSRFLARERPNASELLTIGHMAVTFLEQIDVRDVMKRGGLKQGLALGRQLERLETSELPVGINDVSWVGSGERKLAAMLDRDSEGFGELQQVAETVESVLSSGTSGPTPRVRVPEHVTLLRYGHARDGNRLSVMHKNELEDIAWDVLAARDITTVSLGKLMIGEGYDRPI